MKRATLAALGVIVLLSCACAHTGGKHLNIWPLVYYNENERQGTKTVSVLTPLVYYHRSLEGKSEFALRPIFSVAKDKTDDSTVIDILYPLIKYKKRGKDEKFRIFPIMKDETADVYPDKVRTAHDYFPLYWGTSEDGERYGGFFPLYGTVKKRFGKDEILFLLWPAYSRTEEEGFVSHSVLWPIFGVTTGEGGWGGRFFPLWGHEEVIGKEYKTFYLYPFITLRGRYLDTDSPLVDTYIIPFYVNRSTPVSRSTSYLWPFLTFTRNEQTGYRRVDIPWPFITIARSDTLSITQFAPFYRKRVETEKDSVDESRYILYPIFKDGHFTSPTKSEDTFRFMLIDKYVTTTYPDGADELWIYLFPLYDHRRLKSGEESSVFLYPLPLYDDGFKRNYLPLFEVYRQDTTKEGDTRTSILHHLYIRDVRDGVEQIDAPFYFRERRLK